MLRALLGVQKPYFDTGKHLPFPPLALRFALVCAQMLIYHERFPPSASQLALYRAAVAQCQHELEPAYLRKVIAEFVSAAHACKGGAKMAVHSAAHLQDLAGASNGCQDAASPAQRAEAAADATAHVASSKRARMHDAGHAGREGTQQHGSNGSSLHQLGQTADSAKHRDVDEPASCSGSGSGSLMDAVCRCILHVQSTTRSCIVDTTSCSCADLLPCCCGTSLSHDK